MLRKRKRREELEELLGEKLSIFTPIAIKEISDNLTIYSIYRNYKDTYWIKGYIECEEDIDNTLKYMSSAFFNKRDYNEVQGALLQCFKRNVPVNRKYVYNYGGI